MFPELLFLFTQFGGKPIYVLIYIFLGVPEA
jgi:hypothetical protein